MRPLYSLIALGVVMVALRSNAQQQSTDAPCSPAIAGVQGNVQVMCGTRDQDDIVNRAIRELAGGKPFALNLSMPNYQPAGISTLPSLFFGDDGTKKNGSQFDYAIADHSVAVNVVLDENRIIRGMRLHTMRQETNVVKSMYIKFVNQIGRKPAFYQDDEYECYAIVSANGMTDKINCDKLNEYYRYGACEFRTHIETDGANKMGAMEYTYLSSQRFLEKTVGNLDSEAGRSICTQPSSLPDHTLVTSQINLTSVGYSIY